MNDKKIAWMSLVLMVVAAGCGSGSSGSGAAGSMKATPEFEDVGSASGDLNGDGFADLAVLSAPTDPADARPAYVSVYYGPIVQDAPRVASEHYDTAPSASAVTIADLNEDGTLDLVIAQRCAPTPGGYYLGRVQVYYRATAGGVVGQSEHLLGLDAESVGVADIDGDGMTDLLAGGSGYLFLARGLGARAFEAPTHVSCSGVWTIRKPGTPGVADLAVGRWTNPSIVDVYCWTPGLGLDPAASLTFSGPVSSLQGSDLNHDGLEDLLAGMAGGPGSSQAAAMSEGRFSFTPPGWLQ